MGWHWGRKLKDFTIMQVPILHYQHVSFILWNFPGYKKLPASTQHCKTWNLCSIRMLHFPLTGKTLVKHSSLHQQRLTENCHNLIKNKPGTLVADWKSRRGIQKNERREEYIRRIQINKSFGRELPGNDKNRRKKNSGYSYSNWS